MKQPVWLIREAVLAAHEQLLAEFGGSSGVRDRGLLDSALARPENLFAYGEPTLCEMAASYAFGLVKNHPFVDGNKRIGFAAAAWFLQLNGQRLEAPEADAVVKTLALAASDMTESQYAAWLTATIRSVKRRSSVPNLP